MIHELRTRVFLLVAALLTLTDVAGQKRQFFDSEWKPTDKEHAVFYREVKKKSDGFDIHDFYQSGARQFEGVSKNDAEPFKLNGTAIWYYESGSIERIALFKNEVPVDSTVEFYESGAIKSKAFYKNAKLDGATTSYFPDGSIAGVARYKEGKLNGRLEKYHSPNHPEYLVDYKMDVMDGSYTMFNVNNKVFNEGTTQNGFKEGVCKDYFYEGGLRLVYTIRNKFLDGRLVEFNSKGDTASVGEFNQGVPLYYRSKSMSEINGSRFSKEMKLEGDVEHWTVWRDSMRILEAYYEKGKYRGNWLLFTFDGRTLYSELQFKKNADCGEAYLQPANQAFRPMLTLSDRFGFYHITPKLNQCDDVTEKRTAVPDDQHPVFYMKRDSADKSVRKSKDVDIVHYQESADDSLFIKRNHCGLVAGNPAISCCERTVNGLLYRVYLSSDLSALQRFRSNLRPDDNTLVYLRQKMESRDYDFKKEKRITRWESFVLSPAMQQAVREKRLESTAILYVLEHEFWSVSDFSGGSAHSALEEEVNAR
ncbi:MAG: toxin-antitoxin system YwqK family antitoxin [Chitinophagales bacterium]